MKNLLILIVVYAAGCSDDSNIGTEIELLESQMVIDESSLGKEYFEFDQIIHYHFDISNEEGEKLFEFKTSKDSILKTILIDYGPKNVNDSSFLNNLELMSSKKTIVDTTLFKEFRALFKVKRHENPSWESCIAIWRDIVVFKKRKSTTGIAKIPFGCQRSIIIGSEYNTDEFGQSGDIDKLYGLLYNKPK